MTDKIQQARRAAFEKIYPPEWLRLDPDGMYSGDWASFYNARWEAFNAALDSICIELPILNNSHAGGADSIYGPSIEQVEDAGFDYGVKACRAAIEQTGLGIKIK